MQVDQIDREAAAEVAVLTEMRELIREGRADHHAEPFARHQARAEVVGEIVAWLQDWGCSDCGYVGQVIADQIKDKFGTTQAG